MLFEYTNNNNLSPKSENYNQILFNYRTGEVDTKSD